jgi:hypothetical protein
VSRVFATRPFDRWARKERLEDSTLLAAVDVADLGLIGANLKGCLIKLRVARQGAGKSGGYRTLVAYRTGDRSFFLYGFGKNEKANVEADEIDGYEEYGQFLLGLTDAELAFQLTAGKLREIER